MPQQRSLLVTMENQCVLVKGVSRATVASVENMQLPWDVRVFDLLMC